MTRCPNCFHALTPNAFAWRCVSGQCPASPDPVASAFHGGAVAGTPIRRVERPPGAPRSWSPGYDTSCPRCRGESREICPTCHYELPAGWREGETICLAMAGARATGKSVYVGVLVKQLQQLAEHLRTTFMPVTELTQYVYSTFYERALFEQRGIMPPTPSARTQSSYQREPLVFSLGMVRGRRLYLVLRDVAGEDLETASGDLTHLRFFAHADGVIFMFDPLRVPEVRDQLHDLVPHQLHQGGDPQRVLANLLRIIGTSVPRVAVVLSKFDAMQALRAVSGTAWNRVMSNPGAAFMRDPGLGAGYDEDDGELLHHEVRSLLQRLGAGPLVTALERPNAGYPLNHRFFAISALGESPNGEALHLRGISSFRCLDPVRWVLADAGVL